MLLNPPRDPKLEQKVSRFSFTPPEIPNQGGSCWGSPSPPTPGDTLGFQGRAGGSRGGPGGYLASARRGVTSSPTPFRATFRAMSSAARGEESLATTAPSPGTSRAKRIERSPEAASASSTRRPPWGDTEGVRGGAGNPPETPEPPPHAPHSAPPAALPEGARGSPPAPPRLEGRLEKRRRGLRETPKMGSGGWERGGPAPPRGWGEPPKGAVPRIPLGRSWSRANSVRTAQLERGGGVRDPPGVGGRHPKTPPEPPRAPPDHPRAPQGTPRTSQSPQILLESHEAHPRTLQRPPDSSRDPSPNPPVTSLSPPRAPWLT